MLRALYTLVLGAGLLLALPWLLFRVATRERYRRGLLERFALRLPPRRQRERIWIHAASAGEMVAAAALARQIAQCEPRFEVVMSSTTTAGVEVASRLLPDLVRFIAPLDVGLVARRVFRRMDARVLVLVELELWPNWMSAAEHLGLPVAVANGRVGETTARRLRWSLARRLLGTDQVAIWAVQSHEIRERLLRAGVPESRIEVTGNVKVDVDRPMTRTRAALRDELRFPGDPFVVLAGSTHAGEEGMIAAAVAALRGMPGRPVRLVVAPRHRERLDDAEREVAEAGFTSVRLSALRAGDDLTQDGVVVVDTMGELAELFAVADVAVVGGSLVPGIGGHNVFEPALAGVPTLLGPHHGNVRADARFLADAGALRVVTDAEDLVAQLQQLRQGADRRMAQAARAAVSQARGAARRTVEVVFQRCSVAVATPV